MHPQLMGSQAPVPKVGGLDEGCFIAPSKAEPLVLDQGL